MALPIDVRQLKVENKWEELVLPDVTFVVGVKIEEQLDDWSIQSFKDDNNNIESYQELIKLQEHQCRKCGQSFKNRYTLLQHNLRHVSVSLPPVFESQVKKKLTRHKKSDRVKGRNKTNSGRKCELCNKEFNYKNLHCHMNTVHTNGALPCEICNKKFRCKEYLNKHIRKQHANNAKICKKTYKNQSKQPSLRQEKKDKSGIWKCDQCGSKLNSKYALSTHTRNCHSESVVCEICGSRMKSKSYLLTHLRRVHVNQGHKCDVCGKTIRSPTYLKLHLKNHESKTRGVLKKVEKSKEEIDNRELI